MDTPATAALPTVSVFQAGRRILASGSAIVTYGASPLIVAVGSDPLVVSLDLYTPLGRADGSVVGGPTGPNSVTPTAPLTREVNGCTVSVRLTPVDAAERSFQPPASAGRIGPTSWHLTWEVSQDAPGMNMAAAPEPEWSLPAPPPSNFEFEMPNPWETPARLLRPFTLD